MPNRCVSNFLVVSPSRRDTESLLFVIWKDRFISHNVITSLIARLRMYIIHGKELRGN